MVPGLWHHTTWFAFYLMFRSNFTFCLFDNSFIWTKKKKEHFEIWWLALNWKWIGTVFLINDLFRIFSTELALCILFLSCIEFFKRIFKDDKIILDDSILVYLLLLIYLLFAFDFIFAFQFIKPFFSLYFPSQENIFFWGRSQRHLADFSNEVRLFSIQIWYSGPVNTSKLNFFKREIFRISPQF
jgi:hypothetical protein